MKKFLLAFFAVILAVGMSAFSVISNKSVDHYYFDTDWRTINSSLTCPEGNTDFCFKEMGGVQRQIFKSKDVSDPLLYQ